MLVAGESMLLVLVVDRVGVGVAVVVLSFPEREDFQKYIPEWNHCGR
jgi:hypothetical protein